MADSLLTAALTPANDASSDSDSENVGKCTEVDKKSGLTKIMCDKQNKLEHTGDKYGIFPDTSVRVIINGCSGTGKSFLLTLLIPMLAKPRSIIIATTVMANPVHKGIAKYCKKNHIEYNIFYDPEDFFDHMGTMIEEKDPTDHCIIIFDDFNICKSGKDEGHNNIVCRAFSKYRNYNCSCIVISPDVCDIPRTARNTASARFLFPIDDHIGLSRFKMDIRSKFPKLGDDAFQTMYDTICNNEHTFILWSNFKDKKPCPHIRIGWDNTVYPSNNPPLDDGEDIPGAKKAINYARSDGKGLREHNRLFEEASMLGLPQYYRHNIATNQIQNFIKYQKKRGGTYTGDSEKLREILGGALSTRQTLTVKLNRYIKNYGKSGSQYHWQGIYRVSKQLIEQGYVDKNWVRSKLEREGLMGNDDSE